MYLEQKLVRPEQGTRAEALCPECGYAHPFLRLPLFVVSGASGTGKSTVLLEAARQDQRCVHLESDILWQPAFNQPENDYRDYRNLWLRMCKNIAQGGRPVVLYGSVTPDQFEACPERRYIGPIHTLALVCDPEILASRLQHRPAWRGTSSADFIDRMVWFNAWFLANAAKSQPPITLLDTTHATLDETCEVLLRWIHQQLEMEGTEDR